MSKYTPEPFCECVFEGPAHLGNWTGTQYPCWRYHRTLDPLLVNNKEEDEQCKKEGYDEPCAPLSANKQLINWFWDLEDMSPNQLRVFAMDEFEVDLPEDVSQECLMKVVCRLSKNSPQNQGRLVLMAHTIQMNYDATIEEIKRMQSVPNSLDYNVEVTREEFY